VFYPTAEMMISAGERYANPAHRDRVRRLLRGEDSEIQVDSEDYQSGILSREYYWARCIILIKASSNVSNSFLRLKHSRELKILGML
jgi:hypothetical protein